MDHNCARDKDAGTFINFPGSIKFLQDEISKDFDKGIANFIPDGLDHTLSDEEEGAFTLGFVQGFKTAYNTALTSLQDYQIIVETFNSFTILSDFIQGWEVDENGDYIERKISGVYCCDTVIDNQQKVYKVRLSGSGSLFFKRQDNPEWYYPVDARSLTFPIHIVKMNKVLDKTPIISDADTQEIII